MANENVNKVIYGNDTLIDLTGDSVSPQTLLAGQTAHDRSGSQIVGVATQGHTIIDASGSPVNAESGLQFATMQVTDDSTNGKTVVRHIVDVTQAQYDALPSSKNSDNIIYHITDANANPLNASSVTYSNTTSGMSATNVQSAVDEVNSDLAEKADKAQISNPNLLDNPWFTVNQRGQSSYSGDNTGIYSVDRWKVRNAVLTINSNGSVRLLGDKTAGTVQILNYQMDRDYYDKYIAGKVITFSVLLDNDTILTTTGVAPTSDIDTYVLNTEYRILVNVLTKVVWVALDLNDRSGLMDITIKAIKLELGSISTLALDTAPNYATELLKCQRYFYRLKNDIDDKCFIGIGYARQSDILYDLIVPVVMRNIPTLTKSVDAVLYTKLYASGSVVADSVSLYYKSTNRYGLTIGGSNLTQETCYMIYLAKNGYIDLSADL